MSSYRRPAAFELFAEMQRVCPEVANSPMGGLTLVVSPEEALKRLRVLPDNAGLEALARALGHEPGGPPPSGSSAPPAV